MEDSENLLYIGLAGVMSFASPLQAAEMIFVP
jgi:hypothetical protein